MRGGHFLNAVAQANAGLRFEVAARHENLARPGKSRDASADLERDILRPVPAFMRARWTSYRAGKY
jgi:hypothetical protein